MTYIWCPRHKEQEYKWFWVSILTVFKIFELFLFEGVQDLRCPWPTNHLKLHDIRNKNINGLGVVIFGYFLFEEVEGVRAILKALDINTICSPWHKKQQYIWFKDQDFNSFEVQWDFIYPDTSVYDDFIWGQIFLYIFCLIYPEYRLPNPDVLFLPQNTVSL